MKKSEVKEWSSFNLGRPLFYTAGIEEYDRAMARVLQQAIKNKKTIVELGMGDGIWIEYLARNNPVREFIGVEWNDALLNYAVNRCAGLRNIKLVKADVSTPEGVFECDFFYCFGVIEHFSNTLEVLKLWVEKLQPDGECVITAPNILAKDWLRNRCGVDPDKVRGEDRIITDSYGYEEIFSPNYFLKIIMDSGLEILEYRWLNELPDKGHCVRALKRSDKK